MAGGVGEELANSFRGGHLSSSQRGKGEQNMHNICDFSSKNRMF
jgi:hypothetical protein